MYEGMCESATLGSIFASCDTSIGGIKEVYIALRDDIDFTTIVKDGTEVITTLKCKTGKKFERWQFRKNTGSYTSTATVDNAIGSSFITTEVALQFSRAEAQKRLEIQSALNANAVVIVKDMYDQYIFLGMDNDVNVTAAVMQSGTSNTDLSGFTLTLTDISEKLPYFVDKAVIPGLLVEAAIKVG